VNPRLCAARGLLAAVLLAASFPRVAAASSAAPAAGQPPALTWTLSAAQIKTNCAKVIARAKKSADAIARVPAGAQTFRSVVLPLEDLNANLNDDLVAETLLYNVSTDRTVRDASLACQNTVNDLGAALNARPDLYRAVAAAQASGTAKTDAERKLTTTWSTALRRAGAALPPERRREFVALNQKLSAMQDQFGANLGNDTTSITITKPEAAGLPADFIATFKPAKDAKLPLNTDGYVVPVNESTASRFMENATDANARKAFYLAEQNRGVPKNLTLLRDAIGVRDRLAHLFGYRTWADYVLADRMAGTPQRVRSFLDDLDAKLLPRATSELATLAALKAQTLGVPSATIDPWDVTYYDNLLRKTKYAVDTNEVRQYFPVDHVVSAVLGIYSKLLGVTFAERKPANVWNPDVTQWSVTDAATARYIGDFYLDLFPREGKYDHFASFTLLPNRRLANGSVRPPLDTIIGNWPAPAPGKPALLSHDDVETFFHEFGHDMAAILATTPYETLSTGFRWDFVEAPSQMLENWVWDPQILKEIGSNVSTGAPLPDDLIAKMIAARYVNNAYFTTRQILLATADMDYHTSGPSVDTTAVWAKVAREETPLPMVPGIHPEASFGHLMGGYDAGYYGYLWSRVYAQDMFTAFAQGGLESPVVGARYRQDILQPARQIEPDEEVRNFLGRPMSPVAFYREFGIDVKTSSK
jgi:thimet oligopeptidase